MSSALRLGNGHGNGKEEFSDDSGSERRDAVSLEESGDELGIFISSILIYIIL